MNEIKKEWTIKIKKFKFFLFAAALVGLTVLIALLIGIFAMVTNSCKGYSYEWPALQFAKKSIQISSEVQEIFGKDVEVAAEPKESSILFSGEKSEGKFLLEVKGEKGAGEVLISWSGSQKKRASVSAFKMGASFQGEMGQDIGVFSVKKIDCLNKK
ncbi:MAG: hypothetical protein PHQ11_13770 [Paludibacter sp.]|nr:hypothetical protein [Paludibacter sp.]MDD4429141.1 hypothetical protein [Paludibacter sp.]